MLFPMFEIPMLCYLMMFHFHVYNNYLKGKVGKAFYTVCRFTLPVEIILMAWFGARVERRVDAVALDVDRPRTSLSSRRVERRVTAVALDVDRPRTGLSSRRVERRVDAVALDVDRPRTSLSSRRAPRFLSRTIHV